jgi:hypothetical protein
MRLKDGTICGRRSCDHLWATELKLSGWLRTSLLVLVHALTIFLLLTWPLGSKRRAAFDEANIGRRIGT